MGLPCLRKAIDRTVCDSLYICTFYHVMKNRQQTAVIRYTLVTFSIGSIPNNVYEHI